MTSIARCAVAYECTDIPTTATNELGESCSDFNVAADFKFGMLFGLREV